MAPNNDSDNDSTDSDHMDNSSLNKLIANRAGHRSWSTVKVKRAQTLISEVIPSPNAEDELFIIRETLVDKLRILDDFNRKIQMKLTATDIEADIAECSDRETEIRLVIHKITNFLHAMTKADDVQSEAASQPSQSFVNLPKLNLPKFDGDPKQWTPFWDLYSANVHNNESLTSIQKLSYLRTLITGSAEGTISGIRNTSENYEKTITKLKEVYDKPVHVRSLHINELLNLKKIPENESDNIPKLRSHYNSISAIINNLETIGIDIKAYEALLGPIIIQSLPEEIGKSITKESSDELPVNQVLCLLLKHIETGEKFRSIKETPHNKKPSSEPIKKPPDPSKVRSYAFNTTSAKQKCHFCGLDNHKSELCRKISNIYQRIDIVYEKRLCRNCLSPGHIARYCQANIRCSKCKGRHHLALCLKGIKREDFSHLSHRDKSQETSAASVPPRLQQPRQQNYRQQQQPPPDQRQQDHPPQAQDRVNEANNFHVSNFTQSKNKGHIFLQTGVAEIKNPVTGKSINARILFDDGSMHSYISEELARFLNLPVVGEECFEIQTFGNSVSKSVKSNTVKLQISKGHFNFETEMHTSQYICNPLPNVRLSSDAINELSQLELADHLLLSDPNLNVAILIGSDLYWSFITPHVFKTNAGPMAVSSKLGILLSGPLNNCHTATYLNLSNVHHMNFISHISLTDNFSSNEENVDLSFKLQQFYDLESIGILPQESEATVLSEFQESIVYSPEQFRYTVKLPWRQHMKEKLSSNRWVAEKRLDSLCNKLNKLQNKTEANIIEKNIIERYENILKEQVDSGIIVKWEGDINLVNFGDSYLPHRPVIKEESKSSPVRVVYDGSAKQAGSPSLNMCLHSGPSLIVDLCKLLNQFRLKEIAITADVSKAFLNISVHDDDQNSLRFLWKKCADVNAPLEIYQMQRVPFGLTSSPFLLLATLNFHFDKFSESFPISNVMKDKFYMDDLTISVNDVDTAINLYIEGSKLMALANMKLCKWNSNSLTLREYFTEQMPNCDLPVEQLVLGVRWDVLNDQLMCVIKPVIKLAQSVSPTKRSILSVVASIFDPLGVLSAFTLPAKQIFQMICKQNLGWDEILPQSILKKWVKWVKGLPILLNLSLPRYIFHGIEFENNTPSNVEIHCFSDASIEGYCTIVYLRVYDIYGCAHVRFVMSKTRIAPLKTLSLPRLELMGALLSVRLVSTVVRFFTELSISNVYYYTDSENVIYWIKSPHKTWSVFVNHRLREIRALSQCNQWYHVPGKLNPADIGTRCEVNVTDETLNLWTKGPDFMRDGSPVCRELNVDLSKTPKYLLQELSKTQSVNLVQRQDVLLSLTNVVPITKFSQYSKLVNVTYFVLKAVKLFRKSKIIESELLFEAETLLIKSVQVSHFPVEYREAPRQINNLPVHGKMSTPLLKQLGLFMDQTGLLRCRTRLESAEITYDSKFPLLIPRKSHFTKLLILHFHCKMYHAGVESTLSQLRQQYYVPKGRREVRNVLGGCLTCVRLKANPYIPVNSPALPKFRVSEDRIFTYVGCDFAGPLYCKPVDSKSAVKCYILIYTCLVTRAIKLELVHKLTVTCFIFALRRIISNRGAPKLIVSDNARTFHSVSKELAAILNPQVLQKFCLSNKIEWRFILPLAPWEGGVYERLVRIVKNALRSTLTKTLLGWEEISTTLAEIEICLNCRPIGYLNEDINSNKVLTPALLMYGNSNPLLPPLSLVTPEMLPRDTKFASRRMRYLDKIQNSFWSRWSSSYLQFLTDTHFNLRRRENSAQQVPKENDIVLVKDPLKARYLWKMGRVSQVFKGRDGLIRSVEIKVCPPSNDKRFSETIKRSPRMIVPLELNLQENLANNED